MTLLFPLWPFRPIRWTAAAVVLSSTLLGGVAHATEVVGIVKDETGGALPGVSVELRRGTEANRVTATGADGRYRFDAVAPGSLQVSFQLPNFASVRRGVIVPSGGSVRIDAVLHVSLSADILVTGKGTFVNLADAEDPAQNLIGIALSASQGAITARQLEVRPMMRAGEVLETVPGVIISQHSGEGKANQYYLRGFNLDHGTDFATTVAGMPVNMPTHGHGHGYSDMGFLIPELVSAVQFSKGPYFAEHGDFATAGAANINYVNSLEQPLVQIDGGADRFGRALVAVSPRVGSGTIVAAFEAGHHDGPWERAENYRRFNALARFTKGDAVNGFSVTGMAYRGTWDSSDQVPQRAVNQGSIGRFGAVDSTDGGDSSRYSGSLEWQRTRGNQTARLSAYGIGYDLNLFSNFTFFLDDPERGDQFQQTDRRFVAGARVSHRQLTRWGGRSGQSTFGGQLRHDRISTIGLYHTDARVRLETTREDEVGQTSSGFYAQHQLEWAPWLRSLLGIRGDAYRFDVNAGDPANADRAHAGIVSPKGGVIIGPFGGTELYANAGFGFHSNDARGAVMAADSAHSVRPLDRAKGTELGVRTVAIPKLQSTLALWTLHLDSELVFLGDAGTTKAGRPSHRYGIEFANYFSPRSWLTLDADLSWSNSRFTGDDPLGDHIPGSVETVASAGATVSDLRGMFGSVRLRYFGPRPLVEDNRVRSEATGLVNLAAGYKLTPRVRLGLDVFNLFDAEHSDIDYYYESRLPGEPPEGVADLHFHPTLPRTARIGLTLGF